MDLSGRRCRMIVPDRDLDHFLLEHLPPENRDDARSGTILGLEDDGVSFLVLLERVGRAYSLARHEFELLE